MLTEIGCAGCNLNLANFAQRYVDDHSKLIVMKAKGLLIDLTPFMDAGNAVFDLNNKLGFPGASSVYLVKQQQIDSLIVIDAFNLEHSIQWLSERFPPAD